MASPFHLLACVSPKDMHGQPDELANSQPGEPDNGTPRSLYMKLAEVSTAHNTSRLYADEKCTACGLCADICPMRCIRLDDSGRPAWEGTCTMCLACLHRCPAGAVQHGNDTQHKGRYVNPRVTF